MVGKLSMLVRENLVLCLRNSLVWVVLISMVLIVIVVKFAIPREIGQTAPQYFVDATDGKVIEQAMTGAGADTIYFLENENLLKQKVEDDKSAIGIIFDGDLDDPEFQVIVHTGMNQGQWNLLQASISKMIGTLKGEWDDSARIEFLRPQSEPIPRNLSLVPVLLVFEVLILGFLLVAVFLFQEKGDRVIRAYRISPGGTHLYILSKLIAFLALGLLYAFGIVAFTYGFGFNVLNFLFLTVLGFVLYTLIGFIVALFFEDISGWFTIGIVLLVINMAPGISHQIPGFAPAFMKLIPSYHIIFGYDDVLFGADKNMSATFGLLLALCIIAYLICFLLVNRKLMKEAH